MEQGTFDEILIEEKRVKNQILAKELDRKLKGTRAIDYINPSYRKIYEKAYPKMKAVKG